MNPNYLSQKSSEFFECLTIENASAVPIFNFKPQTKAFQHAHPHKGSNEIHIYLYQRTILGSTKIIYFLFLSTTSVLFAMFLAAFQSALIPSYEPSDFCLPLPLTHSGFLQIKVP